MHSIALDTNIYKIKMLSEKRGSGNNDNLINLALLLKVMGISQQAVLGAVKRE